MEQSEIEILVNEIETRVDRLRSLYDQYFMGIERVPPAVPHKDVERRLQVLRREQIRNTGLRYRFQMVLQRYNTYQSYWMRICRQIEDGTYKRDVIRAKRKEVERAARESIPPPSIDITADLDVLEPELDDEAPTGMLPLIEPKPEKRAIELDLDEIDDLDDLLDEKPTKIRTPAPEKLAAKPAPAKPPSLPQRPPTPGPMRPAATDPSRPPTPGPIKPGVSDPSRPPTPGAIRPVGVPPVGGARPMWKKVSAPAAGVSIPIAESKASPPIAPKQAPAPAAKPEPPKAPPAAAKPAEKPVEKPPAEKPAAAKPAPQPRAARPEPPKPLGPADLSDARVRQIYAEYVRSKRAQNESTAAITYENMAKSIRDSSEKLRDKHGGKKVDFEVQVKDGKTILKPVVKG